jgi:hypothetical protein
MFRRSVGRDHQQSTRTQDVALEMMEPSIREVKSIKMLMIL